MPFYADLSSLYGIPSSSYSAPYLSGPYSGHSSIIAANFARPTSSYSKSRGFTTGRGYKPHLATISETQITNRSTIPRINPPSLLLPPTTNYKVVSRPVFINTADIDVSVNKYRKFERTAATKPTLPFAKKSEMVTKPPVITIPEPSNSTEQNGPFMPRIDNSNTRSTIKRERTVVRIHTDHSQDKKSKESNVLLLKPKWRENFDPAELGAKEKKAPTKTPGAKLMEKFLIKDSIKEEEEDKIRIEQEERKRIREENLKLYEDSKKTRKSIKRKQSVKKTPSFHDICRSISSDKISEDLNPGHTVLEPRRHSKVYCDEETIKDIRRNSAEILQEQVLLLDEILRQQNEVDTTAKTEEQPKLKEETEKRKKKIVKKKSNEKIVLPPDDEEEIKATSLQRRPVKKRRSSTASSLDSLLEDTPYDKIKEKDFQDAIRDTSQPEVEKFEVKSKEDTKKPLKAVIEEIKIDESPKTKRKFAINYTLEEADQKRKNFAKMASESSSMEENEDAAVLKKNLQNLLMGTESKHLKAHADTGVVQNAKPKDIVATNVMLKQAVAPKKGQILLEKNVPAVRIKKSTSATSDKEVNNNDITLLSKSKSDDKSVLKSIATEKHNDDEVDFWSSIDPEENIQKTRQHMKAEQERLQALKWEEEVQKLAEQKVTEEEQKRKQKEAEEEQKRKQKLEEEEEKRKQKLAEEERKRKQKLAEEEEKKKRNAEEEEKKRLQKLKEEEEKKRKREAEEKQRLKMQQEEEERKRKEAEEEARKLKQQQEEEKRLKRQKEEEELKRRRAELEVQKKKLAEETERRKQRLAEEETMRKQKEAEALEKRKQKEEEEERKKKEFEEAEKRKALAEEEAKLKQQEEENRKRLEEEKRKAAEEEKRKKLEEEKKRKQKEEEEKRKKLAEEEQKRKAEEEKRKLKIKEEEERKLKEKLLHEEKVKRQKLKEEMEKKKLLEEARKRREKEEEARKRREQEEEEARMRREQEEEEARKRLEEQARMRREQEEEARKKLEEEAARIKAEYEENLRVKEEMQRKMASKRSIVTKYNTVDDPDLEVFTEPEPEASEKESEIEIEKDNEKESADGGFVPLQSNRLSQFMHAFQKPEQYEECPIVIMATPKPIRKRHYPKPRVPKVPVPAPPPTKEEDEDEDEEDDDDDEDDTEDSSSEEESSREEEEYTLERSGADIGKSTSSTDSGFDSSAPGSPANRRHNECDVNCHKKCEKLTANLCGVNQKLVVEALSSVKKVSSENRDSPTSYPAHNPAFAVETNDAEVCESSSTYTGFKKSGRMTPPATTIPRFKKYAVDDFNFLKVLGKGSFGKVLLAELKNTDYYYAVKCLKKDVVLEDDDVECTLIERKVLALGTKHPYLCHLLCTFQTESHLFFVMEYLNGGDLMFHIQQSGRFPEQRACFYAAEIVSGLKFLHSKGIVYRDLKLDNILLDFDGHVRIADFGMCKLQIFLDRTADTFCGTPDYMAPEIIKGLHYNQSVDWWSFGVLLYEMLIGQSPFSGCDEDELFWSICNERPVMPRFLSEEANSILTLLLEKDKDRRLGTRTCPAGAIQDQPFFRKIDWDLLEHRELPAPFKPKLAHPLDTQYFDKTFTQEKAKLTPIVQEILHSMDQTQFEGFSYTNPNATDR